MKLCTTHWRSLTLSLHQLGLIGATQATLQSVSSLDEIMALPVSCQTFDPVVEAQRSLYGHALKIGGHYLAGRNEFGGYYCPVCEADQRGFGNWIALAIGHAEQQALALLVD